MLLIEFHALGRRLKNGPRILYFTYKLFYRFLVCRYYSVDFPLEVKVGAGLKIHHGYGLVVHPRAIIGNNVVLRHATTIGNDGRSDAAPVLEDSVDVGAGCLILGKVCIGEGAVIGAGSIVTKSVEKRSIVIQKRA